MTVTRNDNEYIDPYQDISTPWWERDIVGKKHKKAKSQRAQPTKPVTGYVRGVDCHNGPVDVMKIGQVTIWAGSRKEMLFEKWDLHIQLSDDYFSRSNTDIVSANGDALAFLPVALTKPEKRPVLTLRWDDYGDIDIPEDWWKNLVEYFHTVKEPMDVGIYCLGGHGRTGTALSILGALSGASEGYDPVGWVRRNYCQECVESNAQLNYVEEMTGVQTKCVARSYSKGYVTGSAYGAATSVPATGSKAHWETSWDKPEEVAKITPDTSMFQPKSVEPAAREHFAISEKDWIKTIGPDGKAVWALKPEVAKKAGQTAYSEVQVDDLKPLSPPFQGGA